MAASGSDAPSADLLDGPDVGARVMRGGIQRTAGFVGTNLIAALAAVLLLRHLGVEDFGRYGTVMALLAIVQGVSDAGLSMTGSRELAVRGELSERRRLLAHLLGLRILLTGVGLVGAVAFALAAGYSEAMVWGTAVAGAGVLVLSVQAAMLLPLVVELRNGRLTLNEVLRQVVLTGFFLALVIAGASLAAFFVAQLLAALVVLVFTPLLLHRHHFVAPRWGWTDLRELALMTLPLAVSSVLSVLYFRILVILMSLFEDSPSEVGYYVTSARIIEIFLALPVVLVGIVLPVLSVAARDDRERLRYVTLRMTQVLALLGVLFALILWVGARPLILILGGEQYVAAAPVLQVQCLALVTIFVTGAWTTTLVGMGRARILALGTALGVVSVTVLGSLLIPRLGAMGGGIAAVLGDLIFSAFIFAGLRRAGPGRGMSAGPFVRIAAAAVPAILVGLLSPLPALADAVVVAVLFPVCAYLAGAVPPEVSDRLRLGRVAR